jgi:WD40 repeat protein
VQLWNLSTRTLERTLSPAGTVVGLAFAGGGRYLVTAVGEGTAQPGLAQLWDLSRPAAAALSLGTDLLGTAAVSPDGQTVAVPVSTSASGPGLIRLWNLTTRQFTTLDTGVSGPVKTLAFSADGGNLAAASDLDGTVKIWELGTAAPPVLLSTLSAGRTAVYSVAFSPDGSTLASTDDNSVALWDVRGNLLGGQANGSVAVAFSPDGRELAVGKLPGTAAGSFATVELYDMPAGKLVATLRAGADDVTALAFSPDGRTLAVAVETAPGTVQMWNVASRRLSGVIATGQQNQIRSIAFSPDGALLATVSLGDADVRLWSATRLTPVAVIQATQDQLYQVTGQWAVAFSPDGRLLAVAGADGATRVYTLPDDKLAGIYFANLNVWTLAFSPVGHTLAIAGTGGDIYLYDNVGEPSTTLYHDDYSLQIPDSSQTVITLAFEPGGRTLIAAGLDGAVRLWNPANGALIASFQASATSIASVAYSGSTGMIATASAVTRVWDTDPGEVAGRICPELQAPVNPAQWDEYVSQYPYTPVCR